MSVTGTAAPTPSLQVLNGATAVTTNNSPAITVGSSANGVAASAYSFTIKNTGTAALTITSITGSTDFAVGTLSPTSPIAAGATATFTVTGTPVATGANTGTVTIGSNDPTTPSFVINVSVTGTGTAGTVGMLPDNAIQISPNPSNGYDASIKFNGTYSTIAITVYSTIGEKILSTEIPSMSDSSQPLTLSNLAAGVYMVEITTDQGKMIQRLIKQ